MRQAALLSPQMLLAAATTMSIGGMVHSAQTTKKRVVYGPSKLNHFVAQGIQPTLDRYTPAWWTNEHIQILLTFVVPQTRVEYTREILTLPDGGQASLDWGVATDTTRAHEHLRRDAPIVVILHGLTGSSVDMQSLCAEALERGYRPVVFNKRGHGGVKLTTPKLQGFGCVDDLKVAVAHIEREFPQAPLYGIGTSAGSGLLCSYLGATADESRIRAGVMISPGYNTFDLFCKGLVQPLYNFLMTRSLQKFLSQHATELQGAIDVDAALGAKSIQEFDELVYMKMHGHADIESYWLHNNPMRELHRAARPILCINALDDPVCTKETIPMDVFEGNPERMLVETERGSHCAFYQGNWKLENWSDGAALTYLDKVREFERREAARAIVDAGVALE